MRTKNNALKEVTLNFNLRDKHAKNFTSIIMVIAYDGKQYRQSTQLQIRPMQWHAKEQRAIISPMLSNNENTHNNNINEKINSLKFAFQDLNMYICNNGVEDLKNLIPQYMNVNTNNEEMAKNFTKRGLFNKAFSIKMEENLAPNTIKGYRAMFSKLMEYIMQDKVVISGNKLLLHDYAEWLRKRLKPKQQNQYASFADQLCRIIITNERTRDCGMPVQIPYTKAKVEAIDKREKVHFALTKEEDAKIKTTTIEDERLNNVRKGFAILLYCGLRHEDLQSVIELVNKNKENKESHVAYIPKKTQKTFNKAYIELSTELRTLCAELENGDNDYLFDNGKFNKDLKKVAQILCLNRERKYFNARKDEWIISPIHEQISAHSARVTKATLSKVDGKAVELIIKEQGWKDEKMLNDIYAQLNEQEELEEFKKLYEKHANKEESSEKTNTQQVEEYKKVLTMMGVDSTEWIEENDIDTLSRMVHNHEQNLFNLYGIDYKQIKEIFNTKQDIKTLRLKLEELKSNKQ